MGYNYTVFETLVLFVYSTVDDKVLYDNATMGDGHVGTLGFEAWVQMQAYHTLYCASKEGYHKMAMYQ
jgi:hypothetical protein